MRTIVLIASADASHLACAGWWVRVWTLVGATSPAVASCELCKEQLEELCETQSQPLMEVARSAFKRGYQYVDPSTQEDHDLLFKQARRWFRDEANNVRSIAPWTRL